MKKLAVVIVVLGLIAVFIGYNVWRAAQEPVTTPPSAVDVGRQKLHQQLEQTKQQDAQVEKQAWNSPQNLRILIQAHQHRIDQLNGNPEATEILAYEQATVSRLNQRVSDLAAQAAATPPVSDTAQSSAGTAQTAGNASAVGTKPPQGKEAAPKPQPRKP